MGDYQNWGMSELPDYPVQLLIFQLRKPKRKGGGGARRRPAMLLRLGLTVPTLFSSSKQFSTVTLNFSFLTS